METRHKYWAENRTLTPEDMRELEPSLARLSHELIAHNNGRTMRIIAGRLVVSDNNVAVVVGGGTAEAGLVGSAIDRALGDIGQLRSELLVAPAGDLSYEATDKYRYVLPVAALLDKWETELSWLICDVQTITKQASYDNMMERLGTADDYLRFGGEKPLPLPEPPPISNRLGKAAVAAGRLTV